MLPTVKEAWEPEQVLRHSSRPAPGSWEACTGTCGPHARYRPEELPGGLVLPAEGSLQLLPGPPCDGHGLLSAHPRATPIWGPLPLSVSPVEGGTSPCMGGDSAEVRGGLEMQGRLVLCTSHGCFQETLGCVQLAGCT